MNMDLPEPKAETLSDYNKFRAGRGSPPIAPAEKYKRQRGLAMSDRGWEGLRELARKLGYSGTNGPNITALLESIGHGQWDMSVAADKETRSA